jgi:alcohol dehydrogenase class IV
MLYSFQTSTRIAFGSGCLEQQADFLGSVGRRPMVVTGKSPQRAEPLLALLPAQGLASPLFAVDGEPTTTMAMEATELARAHNCDAVVAIGGGSAIDTAKAVAALLSNPGNLFDYLEIVGQGRPLIKPSCPFVAIPTTAGTGSEVTNNSVLLAPEAHVKVSLRSASMAPDLAIVDPLLTRSLPPAATAASGMDALSQLLEAYVSRFANPLTDGLCLQGLRRIAEGLLNAYENGDNLKAREDMSLAAVLSGVALANAKLGAIHGLAAPLGGLLGAPHGWICARLLVPVCSANIQALQQQHQAVDALRRYQDAATALTGNRSAGLNDLLEWLKRLASRLAVPPLTEFNLTPDQFDAITAGAQRASSMQGNPIKLRDKAIKTILAEAL